MSLLPIFFGEPFTEELIAPITTPARQHYFKHRSCLLRNTPEDSYVDKDKFTVNVNVQQFNPSEINVKVSGAAEFIIEGKHQDAFKPTEGYMQRDFVRKYVMPPGYDLGKLVWRVGDDSLLRICVPKKTTIHLL